jgi:hypothetical protein
LDFNGIDQANPGYILYPEVQQIHAVTQEVSVAQGIGAWTLGPALKSGIGEGTIWQRSSGTTGGPQGPDVQALLDVIGPAHELLHLVGRTIHNTDPVYTGDRPDTAWYQLYSPSLGGMGGTQGTGNKAWNGRFGGSAAILNHLPYAQPTDAEKWMVVSWVEDFDGGQVRSQCRFMRDDPKGYLHSLVF